MISKGRARLPPCQIQANVLRCKPFPLLNRLSQPLLLSVSGSGQEKKTSCSGLRQPARPVPGYPLGRFCDFLCWRVGTWHGWRRAWRFARMLAFASTVIYGGTMKLRIRYVILALFLLLVHAVDCYAWTGKVVGVADGDTITVLKQGRKVRIRLSGIDTPEKKQAFGNKAKKFTNAKVRGKVVEVDPVVTDRYGRTVAMIYVGKENLNESLVRAGYAWVYRKYCKDWYCSRWLEYEKQARAKKLGLWADPHPMPPWEWRHGGKNAGNKAASVPGPYHGNTSSRVFHRSSCKHYNCRNCTKGFKSRGEAIAAGYKPCGICKP